MREHTYTDSCKIRLLATMLADGNNRNLSGSYDYSDLIEQARKLLFSELPSEDETPPTIEEELPQIEWEDVSVEMSEAQYTVAKHPFRMDELVTVKAGPGSGKTFTLMARIANLIATGALKPLEILVLSMANRSVSALQHHLSKLVGPEIAAQVEVSTFHSFCGAVVDQYSLVLDPNAPKRRLLDLVAWRGVAEFFLLKSVVLDGHTIGATFTAARFDKLLGDIASGNMTTREAAARYKVLAVYLDGIFRYMQTHGMMRYSDLVSLALKVMEKSLGKASDEALLPRIAEYKMVVVDEFQDMYPLLLSVVKGVVEYPTFGFDRKVKKNLVIAGDPNQSIYEFLGGNPRLMQLEYNLLPAMKEVALPLNESYRCSQEILDAAITTCFLEPNAGRDHIMSMKQVPNISKPVFLSCNGADEQLIVADEIIRLICCLGGFISPRDIAVLTRTNAEAVRMQHLLRKNYGIGCTKISLGNVWVQSKFRLFRDILSVISGDADASFCLLHILKIMDRSPGATQRASKIFSRAMAAGIDHKHTFLEDYLYHHLSTGKNFDSLFDKYPASLERIAAFINQIQQEREIFNQLESKNPSDNTFVPFAVVECLQRMCALAGINEYLNGTDNLPPRELLTSFNESLHYSFETYVAHKELQDMHFLDYFLQSYDQEIPPRTENLVQVLTIHSAKGLEFPVVFVLGGGTANGWQTLFQNGGSSESGQARLLYVALTRARDLLYVTSQLQIEDLRKDVRERFIGEVPQFDTDVPQGQEISVQEAQKVTETTQRPHSLFTRLLSDLSRPLPSGSLVKRGNEYYSVFLQKRHLHYSQRPYKLQFAAFSKLTRAVLKRVRP